MLSVVMPVHNAMPHLDQAVESILGQSFTEFEFVILDDASTDGSTERLREWASRDPRIRLLQSDRNLGPVGSSNKVANAARAPFVARMDADDISYPTRLQEQLEVLRDHPDVGVVASLCDMIDVENRLLRAADLWRLARRSAFVPFAHGAMTYRREIFDAVGGYREQCEYWEDQDLIVRMAAHAKVAIITRTLYQIRQSSTSTRSICQQHRLERALNRAYQATDRVQQMSDYEEVLNDTVADSAKVDPRVFIAIGSVRLWSGGKPRLFRRLLNRGALSLNARTLTALVWTAWASASPGTLRSFLSLLMKARNGLSASRLDGVSLIQWRPSEDHRLLDKPSRPRARERSSA